MHYVSFPGSIQYFLSFRQIQGQRLVAVYVLSSLQSADYHIFVHLEGDEEAGSAPGLWGQADGRPVCWTYPAYDWRPGQTIADQHAIPIKPDTPPGDYSITVGMYLPETGARLSLLDEVGNPVTDSVKLTTVSIR